MKGGRGVMKEGLRSSFAVICLKSQLVSDDLSYISDTYM